MTVQQVIFLVVLSSFISFWIGFFVAALYIAAKREEHG